YCYCNLKGNRIIRKKRKYVKSKKDRATRISIQEKLLQVGINFFVKILKNPRLNKLAKNYFCNIRTNIIKKFSPDIVYCINGQFIKNEVPWVIDVEHVGVFTVNYNHQGLQRKEYKSYIENFLISEYCKKILPYSETSKNSILANLNCKKFIEKIEVVPNAVKFKKDIKKVPHQTFNILFTGSVQNEDEFYNRGGQELTISFLQMIKKYPKINLIIRAKIPKSIKNILQNKKNIQIYEKPLIFNKFEELFLKSDLYILLGYSGYAISILEAMNYGLPIITTDFLENGDKVENGFNGFKIIPSRNKPKFHIPFIPIHYTKRNKPAIDKDFIRKTSEKIIYLYENDSEREKMGKNSRNKLKKEFSLEIKNKMLKDIFDKI
ncbi:MAG: glycosyltransferase, partial [Candidatus Hodarchaeota archaeon]